MSFDGTYAANKQGEMWWRSGYTKNIFLKSTEAKKKKYYSMAQFKCVPGTLAFLLLT